MYIKFDALQPQGLQTAPVATKGDPMRALLSKTETLLLAAGAALLAVAVFGPVMHQAADFHAFADRRTLWGVPFAMDVMSNLPFALAGLAGAWALCTAPARSIENVERAMAALFFAGLTITAVASGWYHWRPDDAGLAIDRIGMAVAFAGLLGLGAAVRVSERAGAALGLAVLVLAPLAVLHWSDTGNLLPWAALQGGGMALVLAFAWMRPRPGTLDVRWLGVIAAYGAAKLLELNDHELYRITGEWVSGHTLKHMVAALAALPVISAVRARRFSKQNGAGIESTRRVTARRAGHAS
jgi:hypothetical protein